MSLLQPEVITGREGHETVELSIQAYNKTIDEYNDMIKTIEDYSKRISNYEANQNRMLQQVGILKEYNDTLVNYLNHQPNVSKSMQKLIKEISKYQRYLYSRSGYKEHQREGHPFGMSDSPLRIKN